MLVPAVPNAALVAVLLLAGCSGDPDQAPSTSAMTTQRGGPSGAGDVSTGTRSGPLVGEWQRLTTCEERVAAFTAKGLRAYAAESVVGDSFIPGVESVDQLEDPTHPCRGAAPQKHSHFFTDDGMFGSRDQHGEQVDEDPYQVTKPNTVRIGKSEFRFNISGNVLRLYPVLPPCAAHGCWIAQWQISVSYNGLPWRRIG